MNAPRQTVIDALKALASLLVVLHHLSAYGPVSDATALALPATMDWLYDYGRMAVQVFLVLGGYLSAHALLQAMRGPLPALGRALASRYLRLVPPFVAALALALVAALWARPWLSEDLLSPTPRAFQMLAHLLLLQELFNVGAISAGAWYVAIDFQLYALLAALLWLSQRRGPSWLPLALVTGTAAASLLVWNGRAVLDDWAIYFFGAYGLGALARWTLEMPHRARLWLAGLLLAGVAALVMDFRPRILVALSVTGVLLLTRGQWPGRLPGWAGRALASLSRTSYALFLVHFPVLLVGNAWFVRSGQSGPAAGIAALLLIVVTSLILAWCFERWVEAPLGRRLTLPKPATQGRQPADRPDQARSATQA